jgi:cytoskeletal protein CcmA (bactofilin family)
MLSNFGNRKPDKDEPANAAPAPSGSPATPPPTPVSAQRAPMTARTDRPVVSMIGPDLQIVGNLVSKGEVHIEGEVQGDILGTHVMIGERAQITGGVAGDEVVVRGKVMGSVRGKKVALQATSHVEGDIYHKSLAIEQGAYFEGKSRRAEDPVAQNAGSSVPAGTPAMAASSSSAPANPLVNGTANGSTAQ